MLYRLQPDFVIKRAGFVYAEYNLIKSSFSVKPVSPYAWLFIFNDQRFLKNETSDEVGSVSNSLELKYMDYGDK